MAPETKVAFVDLGAQYRSIEPEVRSALEGVLERGDFILGSAVADFERAFASYIGVSYAVGVDSGLSALELGLMALGVGPGDEVITAANSFVASALPIASLGATPVLVDVEEDSFNLAPSLVEAAITPRTKVIMPVHLYGQMADMKAVCDIAARHGLKVLEDACQAHGARLAGQRAGSFGDAAAFSFYPAKNLGAYGDGGMLVTNDPEIDERVRLLRNYGSKVKYHHEVVGMNRRLDTLQAAVLEVKLAKLDAWNAARMEHAAQYGSLLADSNVQLPEVGPDREHVFHLYVVRSLDRDGLQAYLAECGVSTGIHYPIPIHLQPAFRSLGYAPGDFPITERLAGQILSLPMFPEMTELQVSHVARAVTEYSQRTSDVVRQRSDRAATTGIS